MKSIYIINSSSRASCYGIGTYVRQLIDVLKDSEFNMNVVNLYEEDLSEPCIETVDGIRYFKIMSPRLGGRINPKDVKRYYRSVYYFLLPYINEEDELIFHFNFVKNGDIAKMLKDKFNCKTVLTVHYMDWSFDLLGDVERFKAIISGGGSDKDLPIKKSFESEQKNMSESYDRIIAIAQHSYETLCSIYKIPQSKLTLVANGLQDEYRDFTMTEKKTLRESFCLREDEILLVFAGRLDEVKGVDYLLKALKIMLKANSNARLIIAGDGNYKSCFENIDPFWAKISYTGFINREKLYQLYSIADVGIVPSLHEEFGYVAIEMMMNGLPVIVNKTTGLSEIIEDGVNGSCISIDKDPERMDESLRIVSSKIEELIQNKQLREKYALQGREIFKLKYDVSLFKNKMLALYENIL